MIRLCISNLHAGYLQWLVTVQSDWSTKILNCIMLIVPRSYIFQQEAEQTTKNILLLSQWSGIANVTFPPFFQLLEAGYSPCLVPRSHPHHLTCSNLRKWKSGKKTKKQNKTKKDNNKGPFIISWCEVDMIGLGGGRGHIQMSIHSTWEQLNFFVVKLNSFNHANVWILVSSGMLSKYDLGHCFKVWPLPLCPLCVYQTSFTW